MSFVGKILIVVQVVMSLVFMVFAGAVYTMQTNWKQRATELQSQVQTAQRDHQDALEQLNRRVSSLEATAQQERNRADEAVNRNLALDQRVAQLTRENNQLNQQYQTQSGIATAKSGESAFRQEEAQLQRIQNEQLRKALDDQVVANRRQADELYNQRLAYDQLAARHDGLLEQVAYLEKVVRNHNLETDPQVVASLSEPPPPVEGIVLETRKDRTGRTRFVHISIGSNDGINQGHELDVYRSAAGNGGRPQYLGRIRIIENVYPNEAVGEVVQAARNGIIEEGDNVTTKL